MVAKRAGASLGGSRKRARDETAAKCEEIAEALKEAQCLQDSMRDMLGAGATAALSRYQDDRHSYQAAVVSWIGEAFGTIQASLEQCAMEAKANVDNADAEKATLTGAASSAEESLAKLCEALVEAQIKSSDLEAAVGNATGAVDEAKSAEESGEADTAAAATKKADLEALLAAEGQYAKWKTDEAAKKKDVAAFVRAVKSKSKFEQDLLTALAPTLLVEPSARTEFDRLVLQHFDQAVEKEVAAQASTLEAAEPPKAQRAAATAEKQAALDAAQAAAKEGSTAAAEAEAAVKQGQAELKAAQKAVRDHGPAVKEAAGTANEADAKLQDFRGGPLNTFEELRDRTPPVEEPVCEVAAETQGPEAESAEV